jgi:hypothetical protein
MVYPHLLTAPSYNFTRPSDTTAYTSGDLVANSTTAGSVVPMSWIPSINRVGFWVKGVRLKINNATITNATFRVHIYNATPTFVTGGDNSAFGTVVATGYAAWLDSFDVTLVGLHADGAAGIAVPTEGAASNMPHPLAANTTVYGLIEARAAYTPASGSIITAELLVEQN